MNIALVGAFSTGRTTLAKALHLHFPDLKLITSKLPFKITHSASNTDLKACQIYLRTFRKANWQFISDRSGLDPIGFASARDHWDVLETLIETAQHISSRLTYLFYVPPIPEIPVLESAFQGLVDRNIKEFLDVYAIPHTSIYSHKLEDRVDEIVRHISLHTGGVSDEAMF